MFGLIPNNLSSYGNEAVAVPHPPLRGTFPPGEGISANPQSFKQQFSTQASGEYFLKKQENVLDKAIGVW